MEAQFFDTPAELRAWFEQHHESAPELFVGYWKKSSGRSGVTHPQAIEQALCFGWIDSVGRSLDEQRYQVRFTPRRKGSVWSAINVAKVAELIEAGLMRPAGLSAFELRKPDRVAVYSYEQPADAVLDDEQTALFQADEAAWQWFSAQRPSYRRAAVHWVVSAKRADTRQRRLAQLITDSAAGRKVPPLVPR
ncbi:YdeI/OmpD-associated family protein [Actinoplanes solisilvae]|uniref:YdeI/OmpD-associated family protein n=1 Tax=Actinoplanes solisilvae TaxID=2486853 RepID=UPI000FD94095|nr:YdeI/OmpD-associated family protein [Actinoplanes solisilvae]